MPDRYLQVAVKAVGARGRVQARALQTKLEQRHSARAQPGRRATRPPPRPSISVDAQTASAGEVEREARQAGLIHVTDEQPGFHRRRCGRGFTYIRPDGHTLRDEGIRDRIKALAIPPAWTDVWVCTEATGHLQATGHDEAGRKQYLYHVRWEHLRDLLKFRAVLRLGEQLPLIRVRVGKRLAEPGLTRERALAAAVRLLDRTGLRIGTPEYATRNGSYGLTTLRRKHLRLRGRKIRLDFVGKGGRDIHLRLEDRPLARFLSESARTPGWELFKYLTGDGDRASLTPDDVNTYIGSVGDGPFTAKDFRTWRATVEVLVHLSGHANLEEEDRKVQWLAGVDHVAEQLANTRSVVRESYLPPGLEDRFVDGSYDAWAEELTSRAEEFERPGRRSGESLALALLESLLEA